MTGERACADLQATVEAAQNQLTLVLGFFPRVDTMLATILGLNVAMLGVTFARAPALTDFTSPQAIATILYLGASISSFFYLYRGSFPNTDGGVGSPIFFGSIARQSPHEYVSSFQALSPTDLAEALLHQAWRNSCILTSKFSALKSAYRWMLGAAGPWAIALLLFPPPAYQ